MLGFIQQKGIKAHCCETAIGNVASKNQDCEKPSLDVCKGFHNLTPIDLCILVPGLVCSHSLDGNHSLFLGEEFSIRGRIGKSEQHEYSPEKSGDPENDEQPLRME